MALEVTQDQIVGPQCQAREPRRQESVENEKYFFFAYFGVLVLLYYKGVSFVHYGHLERSFFQREKLGEHFVRAVKLRRLRD